jgi:sulfide dehydrogenase cytochrome subunit
MTTQRVTGLVLLTGVALYSILSAGARAADVEKLVEDCSHCHGRDGVSSEPAIPTIAGFSAPYGSDSLIAYKEEERLCIETEYPAGDKKGQKTDMCKLTAELNEKEMMAIAKYYAAKPFVRAKQDFDPALAEKGKAIQNDKCVKCHAEGGSLASDDSGILAGQWTPYLREAFRQYSSGERPMIKKMKKKYDTINDDDIEALLHYFASFQ